MMERLPLSGSQRVITDSERRRVQIRSQQSQQPPHNATLTAQPPLTAKAPMSSSLSLLPSSPRHHGAVVCGAAAVTPNVNAIAAANLIGSNTNNMHFNVLNGNGVLSRSSDGHHMAQHLESVLRGGPQSFASYTPASHPSPHPSSPRPTSSSSAKPFAINRSTTMRGSNLPMRPNSARTPQPHHHQRYAAMRPTLSRPSSSSSSGRGGAAAIAGNAHSLVRDIASSLLYSARHAGTKDYNTDDDRSNTPTAAVSLTAAGVSSSAAAAVPLLPFADVHKAFERAMREIDKGVAKGRGIALRLTEGYRYYFSEADSYTDINANVLNATTAAATTMTAAGAAPSSPREPSDVPSSSPATNDPLRLNFLLSQKISSSPRSRAVIYTGKSVGGLVKEAEAWLQSEATPMIEALEGRHRWGFGRANDEEEEDAMSQHGRENAANNDRSTGSNEGRSSGGDGHQHQRQPMLIKDGDVTKSQQQQLNPLQQQQQSARLAYEAILGAVAQLVALKRTWGYRWDSYAREVKALTHNYNYAPLGRHGASSSLSPSSSSSSSSSLVSSWFLQTLLLAGIVGEDVLLSNHVQRGGEKGGDVRRDKIAVNSNTVGGDAAEAGRLEVADVAVAKLPAEQPPPRPATASASSLSVSSSRRPLTASASRNPPPPPPPPPPILKGIIQPSMYSTIQNILAYEKRSLCNDTAVSRGNSRMGSNNSSRRASTSTTLRPSSASLVNHSSLAELPPPDALKHSIVVEGTERPVPLVDWQQQKKEEGEGVGVGGERPSSSSTPTAIPFPTKKAESYSRFVSALTTAKVTVVQQPPPDSRGSGGGGKHSTMGAANERMMAGINAFVPRTASNNSPPRSGGQPHRPSPPLTPSVPSLPSAAVPRPWSASTRSFKVRNTNNAASITLAMTAEGVHGENGEKGPSSSLPSHSSRPSSAAAAEHGVDVHKKNKKRVVTMLNAMRGAPFVEGSSATAAPLSNSSRAAADANPKTEGSSGVDGNNTKGDDGDEVIPPTASAGLEDDEDTRSAVAPNSHSNTVSTPPPPSPAARHVTFDDHPNTAKGADAAADDDHNRISGSGNGGSNGAANVRNMILGMLSRDDDDADDDGGDGEGYGDEYQ